MYYKIEKDNQSGDFIVTRQKYRDDPFKFVRPAKRVLQFDSALLLQNDGNDYILYITSLCPPYVDPDYPAFITADISQYRVFRNSTRYKKCILALKIEDYWTFLVPEDFRYYLGETLTGRLETLPKIPATDSPAYFKKGFEDTLEFIFHTNGKDYLVNPIKFALTGTAAQIEITEFAEITPLPPKGYYKAISETDEHLFHNGFSYGNYVKFEPFVEEDYPEEFKSHYGYWGKDVDGNILVLHITDLNGSRAYSIRFEEPAKSVHFYSRTYTDTVNKYYYDIWQVIYADGQKQLQIKETGDVYNPVVNQDAWNF